MHGEGKAAQRLLLVRIIAVIRCAILQKRETAFLHFLSSTSSPLVHIQESNGLIHKRERTRRHARGTPEHMRRWVRREGSADRRRDTYGQAVSRETLCPSRHWCGHMLKLWNQCIIKRVALLWAVYCTARETKCRVWHGHTATCAICIRGKCARYWIFMVKRRKRSC